MIVASSRSPDSTLKFDEHPERRLVREVQTAYQHVQITHHPTFGHQLIIDGDLQISESDRAYNTAMVAPLLTLECCETVGILGGGDGGVLGELLQSAELGQLGLRRVTQVDIDGTVLDLCRRYLPALHQGAFDDPRAEIRIGDAYAWLAAQEQCLDAVIYDLTMDPVRDEQSRHDFIRETVALIARGLRRGGVVSMQCCGLGDADERSVSDREVLLADIRACLAEHFHGLTEQHTLVPSFGELWLFLAGSRR